MSLKESAVEALVNIIINVISGDISNSRDSLRDKIAFWKFKRQTGKWIKQFIEQHDGTILMQGGFYDYLKYYNPIEEIYNYINKPDRQEVCKEEFLDRLSDLCIKNMKMNEIVIPILEEKLPKKLFVEVYNRFRIYLEDRLTQSERGILSEIEQTKHGIAKIVDGVAEGNYKLDEILNKIESENKLEDKSEIEEIYYCLNFKLMKGEISEVKKLFPVLKGKNADIENALKIKVSVLEEDDINYIQVTKLLKKFVNLNIRDDVIRLLVIFNIDDSECLRGIHDVLEDGSLKQLIDVICKEQWDNVIVKSLKDDVIKQYEYKLTDNYKDEEWIKKRLALYYITRQPLLNVEQIIDLLLNDKRNFIDEMYSLYKKIECIIQVGVGELSEEKKHQLLKWQEELLANKDIYLNANTKIGIMYCTALLRTMLILINGDIEELYTNLSPKLKAVDAIKAFEIQSKIENSSINEDKLIKFCVNSEYYWLLNNYCIKYYSQPKKIICIIEKCRISIEKDIFIYLIYVQAINTVKGKDDALILMDKYKDIYEKYLNYWILYMKLKPDISIDKIFQKWSDGEIIECGFDVDIDFVNELLTRNEYEKAGNVINKLEKLQIIVPLLIKMKAKVLIAEGYELDALNELEKIYPYYTEDAYVIYTIIAISLNNKRKISSEVIDNAKKNGSARLLMLLACVYEIENEYENAMSTITKALLRANYDEKDIYGKYFGMHIGNSVEKVRKIACVDGDTTVYLRCIEDNAEKIYCVYSEKILYCEPYTWENAIHIYTGRAIEMGLLRKRKGDILQIDGSDYEVIEIMPVDCFLLRTCLKKLRDIGGIKEYSLPKSSDGQLDVSGFASWIKENMFGEDDNYKWFDNYKDLSSIPVSLYKLHSFTRLTYSQFIMSLMEEKMIIIRSLLSISEIKFDRKYVLSYSSVVMMYKLGIDIKYLNKVDVVVPESTKIMAEEESNKIYRGTNRETVASIGVIENRLFMQEDNEDEKLRKMQEAINLKNYIQQISSIKNNSDIRIEELKQLDMKNVFGICDYDAIALSRNEGRILVSGEVYTSALAQVESSEIKDICLVDFLCTTKVPVDKLIEYMIKMVRFQFQVFASPNVIRYLIEEVGNIEYDDLRESLLIKWINFVSLGDELEGEYKKVFIQMLTDIFRSLYEENVNSKNSAWINFGFFVVRYNIQGITTMKF